VRTLRRRGLLFDRANQHQPRAQFAARQQPRRRRHEGGERAFGIDRATAIELAILDPHRHHTRHRIDMAEQHDLRPCAGLTHGVARAIDIAVKSQRLHLLDQEARNLALLAGDAGDAQHLLQECDRIEIWLGHRILYRNGRSADSQGY
jgi:hypothetical protein